MYFPKSVRNRCVIKVFLWRFFMLSHCCLDFSVGVGAFVTGLSQISSFFSCDSFKTYKGISIILYIIENSVQQFSLM